MKTKHLIAVPLAVAASMGVAPAAHADTLGDLDVVAEVEITSDSELMHRDVSGGIFFFDVAGESSASLTLTAASRTRVE